MPVPLPTFPHSPAGEQPWLLETSERDGRGLSQAGLQLSPLHLQWFLFGCEGSGSGSFSASVSASCDGEGSPDLPQPPADIQTLSWVLLGDGYYFSPL